MDSDKLDELASGLDDLTLLVDELKEERSNEESRSADSAGNGEKLEDVHAALEAATEAVDELEEPEGGKK